MTSATCGGEDHPLPPSFLTGEELRCELDPARVTFFRVEHAVFVSVTQRRTLPHLVEGRLVVEMELRICATGADRAGDGLEMGMLVLDAFEEMRNCLQFIAASKSLLRFERLP